MSGLELLKLLNENCWYEVRQKGSHKIFKHVEKEGIVVLPFPRKDILKGTLKAILKQAGIGWHQS